jgi:hypothetical protein
MALQASLTRATQKKTVGELLWLAVTAVAFAIIMGIVCWPLSAELAPRLATVVASGSRDVSIAPVPSASTSAPPSPTYSVNRLPLPEVAPLHADLAAAASSGGVPAIALGAPVEPTAVQPSQKDTGGPAPAARRPQQARSDTATRKKAASPTRAAPTLTPPKVNDRGW